MTELYNQFWLTLLLLGLVALILAAVSLYLLWVVARIEAILLRLGRLGSRPEVERNGSGRPLRERR